MVKWLKLTESTFDSEKLLHLSDLERKVLLELLAYTGRCYSVESIVMYRVVPFMADRVATVLNEPVSAVEGAVKALRDADILHATFGADIGDKALMAKAVTPKEADKEEKRAEIRNKVITHLNEVCGTKYRPNVKNTAGHISARLDEGFVLEDFIAVIDLKAKEWLDNAEMAKYLRPETLFSTKFERYLNEAMRTKSKPKPIPEEEERKAGMTDEEWDNL